MSSQATLTKATTNTSGIVTPKIEVTKIYGLFQLMGGNRPIDYNHVKRLKQEMRTNPHLLATNPISVNENMYIIDGQHRRMAAQELGVPLYYIVTPGITLEDTRSLNTTQKRWTLMDFARSYADSGREDYKIFVRVVNDYQNIAPGILRMYLMGGEKAGMENDFKRGDFVVDDESHARNNIEKLDAIIRKSHVSINTPMARGFLRLFENPKDFDYDFFMQKLERESAQELLRPASAIRQCLRSIEDVYNFQSKMTKRLY